MAGNDPQRQLLTLIRDFASEKSQGERRVVGLKKRIGELQSELEATTAELEEAKRSKEMAEQEIKGYEVESSLNDSSILALEARVSLIQDDISSVATEIEGLKRQEGAMRDEFMSEMFQLNSRIRKFHESIAFDLQENNVGALREADNGELINRVPDLDSKTVEDMLAHVLAKATKEEQEYVSEECVQKQLHQEYVNLQKKVSLMGMIMEETKALQDTARQASELEQTCGYLGEELQKRCICPSCHKDNSQSMGETLLEI